MLKKRCVQIALLAALGTLPLQVQAASANPSEQAAMLSTRAFDVVPGIFALPVGEAFDEVFAADPNEGVQAIEVHGVEGLEGDGAAFVLSWQFAGTLPTETAQKEAAGVFYAMVCEMFGLQEPQEPVVHAVYGFPALDVAFDLAGSNASNPAFAASPKTVILRLVVSDQAAYLFATMANQGTDLSTTFRAMVNAFQL